MKRFLSFSIPCCLWLVCSLALGAQPVLQFSDLTWGPKTGWEGSSTKGAAVTVWGRNFGSTRGTSYVTVNGARLTADTDYAEWGGSGPARGLERITFWLNANCADGAGEITVTVNGVTSNALAFAVSPGTIYFVSPSGNNSNNGLYSTPQAGSNGPFRDVYMFSLNHNPSGDGQYIVYVRAGTYSTEDTTSDRTLISFRGPSGAATKQKALIGYPAETPVLNVSATSRAAIWNADYSPYGRNSYLTYSKLQFTNGTEAIYCYGDYIRVIGNTFQNMMAPTWSGVVFMANSRYNRVYGNLFDHNGALADGSYKHNVYMISTDLSEHVSTEYDYLGWNEFSNAESGSDNRGGVFFARTSSDAPGTMTNHLYVHDNYFHGGNQNFIEIGDGPNQTEIYIYNNVFTGGPSVNAAVAIRWTTANAYLYNNTFYFAGAGSVAPVGLDGNSLGSHVTSKNNIFYGIQGQPFFAVDYTSSLVSDHDLFYAAGNFSVPSGPRITVTNPLAIDPRLADPAGGDFHLLSASPAIDAGTNTVNAVVIQGQDGVARPQGSGYDVGAFEYFTGSGSSAPSIASVSCTPAAIVTPGGASCEIALTMPAPGGGLQLALSSSAPALTVPGQATVPAGALKVAVNVTASAVSLGLPARVSASLSGSSGSSDLWLLPTGSPAALAVTHAASFATCPVTAGGMVAIFGLNLGPADPVSGSFTGTGFTTTLAGTTVYFDDKPAPLLAVSASQVNAVLPYSVDGKASVRVEVDAGGRRSNPLLLSVAPTAPGVFTMDASGQGQVVAVNENGRLNSEANPASPGSWVFFYAAGLGQTDPPGIDGSPVPIAEPLPRPVAGVSVQMGGIDAQVSYSGGAPTFIAGLHQINAQVPIDAAANSKTLLLLTAGTRQSQPGITLAVGTPGAVPAAGTASRPATIQTK